MINEKRITYKTKPKAMLIALFRENSDRGLTSRDCIRMTEGKIGEATIYRLLNKLTDEGILERSQGQTAGTSAYRLREDECGCRFHLHCIECGTILHMDCHEMKEAETHIIDEHGFAPIDRTTVINGICQNCRVRKTDTQIGGR